MKTNALMNLRCRRFAAPLAILLLTVAAGCSKEQAPAPRAERPALTMVVGAAALGDGKVYSGEISARHETLLGFRIGGKIVERLVDVGAVVKAGQILARLDGSDTGLQVNSAQAQLQLAEADAKRFRELRAKGFVSQAALDAKETALQAAASQAGLAHNQATYTTLRADHAGVIAATLADAGQVVGAGQPVVRLAQDGEREVALAIPESQLAGLKPGAQAEVELWAGAGAGATQYRGRLRELSPAADPVSRTYPARIALEGAAASLPLGMTARVRLVASEAAGSSYLLPLTAIFQQGDRSAVWIVADDGSLSLRPVMVQSWRNDGAVVVQGLAAGERIIRAGVHKLNAGEKIRIVESNVP